MVVLARHCGSALLVAIFCSGIGAFLLSPSKLQAETFSVDKIWDKAPHSAFTDLVKWRGVLYCSFREGEGHVGGDGVVRILASADGSEWKSVAAITEPGIDLRDPKLSVMPDSRLMMTCGGSDYSDGLQEWHTRVSYSDDAKKWSKPRRVRGIPSNNWFFRLTWHNGVGYVAPNICPSNPQTGRVIDGKRTMAIFRTVDGMNYERVSPHLNLPPTACEATIRFDAQEQMLVLIRGANGPAKNGFIAVAQPPYQDFEIRNLAYGMGGPNFIELPGGEWLVGTREHPFERSAGKSGTATVLLVADATAKFDRVLELPSGGDTSYTGFVLDKEVVWVSYYSSHEGRSSIYVAKIPLSILKSSNGAER